MPGVHNHHIQFQKTRLAPTPSGFLHLGNIFSFALTAALAKKTKASIFLRIDDLDRQRIQPPYVQDIFDTLGFMQIPWQLGPVDRSDHERHYAQIHRVPLYEAALQQLRDKGLVYACTCSRAQVLKDSPNGIYAGTCRHRAIPLDDTAACWRLNTTSARTIITRNIDGSTSMNSLPPDMQDVVVRRKGGFPAYQLSSLVDDVHFGIDLVVRGQDLWPSTLLQLHLAALLGLDAFSNAAFCHHQLVAHQGKKLSKSAGDTSIRFLRRHHTKEEIYALLGLELKLDFVTARWEDFEALL